MSASLVGSEMCIRDRVLRRRRPAASGSSRDGSPSRERSRSRSPWRPRKACLLYTSDAADDM
eukprot:13729259-Alexandrium_andersonii.AAC.1